MSIRVLIADDHPIVRDGLRFCIERWGKNIEITGEAQDGMEVLQLAKKHPIDVFILDVAMPLLNGLDTTRALLREQPTAKIIVLSFHTTRGVVEEAMRAGARGYLTKETASRHIVEAVRQVAGGRSYLSPDVDRFMVELAFKGHRGRRNQKDRRSHCAGAGESCNSLRRGRPPRRSLPFCQWRRIPCTRTGRTSWPSSTFTNKRTSCA